LTPENTTRETSGPDLWTAELLRQFQAAVKDNADEPDKGAVLYIGDEPPTPAA
jgi:hypothetical protein